MMLDHLGHAEAAAKIHMGQGDTTGLETVDQGEHAAARQTLLELAGYASDRDVVRLRARVEAATDPKAGARTLKAWLGFGRNRVVVVNSSGQAVEALTVDVCGERLSFDDLAPGAEAARTFRVHRDGRYVLSGRLADGTSVSAANGYATGGMYGERPRFTLHPGGAVDFAP